ncbi:MAG: stage II sporulation protein M [Planctomycetes bacterium]|nr:stage II sporulation protein M [Planctomycetota bacterium]
MFPTRRQPHHPPQPPQFRAFERWRYLAHEGLRWSRQRPKTLAQVEQFTSAYRQAATELARVRAFSPDKRMAEYIEQAVATAHFAVYRKPRTKFAAVVRGALFEFPALVRRLWAYHALSFAITMVTALIAFLAVWIAPETYYLFVDRGLAGGRDPSASADTLAQTLGPQPSTMDESVFFSQFLFTHNTQVAFLCFSLGIMAGLPTMYLLCVNGLMLGAFTALFVSKGLSLEYFAWILPHGVPEIGAIILCGGAGMAIGHRLLNPGGKPRAVALRETAGAASLTALGCVPLLFTAGLIEGIFRQSEASVPLRYALFGAMLAIMVGWLGFVRRRPQGDTFLPVS